MTFFFSAWLFSFRLAQQWVSWAARFGFPRFYDATRAHETAFNNPEACPSCGFQNKVREHRGQPWQSISGVLCFFFKIDQFLPWTKSDLRKIKLYCQNTDFFFGIVFFSKVKKSQFSDNCQWHLVKHGLLVLVGVFRTDSQLRTASVRVVPQGSNKVCGGTGPLGCKHLGSKFCASWGGKNGRDGIGYTRISIHIYMHICMSVHIYIHMIFFTYIIINTVVLWQKMVAVLLICTCICCFSLPIFPGFCNPQQ